MQKCPDSNRDCIFALHDYNGGAPGGVYLEQRLTAEGELAGHCPEGRDHEWHQL